jgi:hypothetical protein
VWDRRAENNWARLFYETINCERYVSKAKQSRYTPWWFLGERIYSSYSFLTSEPLDGGECQRHAPAALCCGERTPGTHCTGGWVDLDTEVRGKILYPCRGSNHDRPVVQSVVRHYTDWATPAPTLCTIPWKFGPLSPWHGAHSVQRTEETPSRYGG